MSEHTDFDDAATFIRALVGAWDCCATCAGGVLLRHDRVRMAQAWDEGFMNAAGQDHPAYPRTRRIDNPYETTAANGDADE